MMKNDDWFMKMGIEQAQNAAYEGEVPIGALVVSNSGDILSQAYNKKESSFCPCDHAEVLALNAAGAFQKAWRLEGASVYVTLEPCPMCLSAMIHARIKRLVFGAYDPKGGALSLGYNFHRDRRLNHSFQVSGGIQHFECSKLLSDFFRQRRQFFFNPYNSNK